MRIFLTGASGFIGSRILPALQASGHQVIGLARSDTAAQTLKAAGVEVHRGTLDAPDSLLAGVEGADAVIHTAFDDDGSGVPARESFFNSGHPSPRTASELAGQQLLEAGVDVRVVRLPQVHDTVRQGLLTSYIERAVANGAVALRGEGSNRWSAAHVNDVARLYVSALLQGAAGERYHAVDEEGIALRDIATVIAQGLNLPLTHLDESQVDAWFGWLAPFTALDLRASSAWTRERLQWQPVGPGLLEDLRNMDYQKVTLSR